MRRKAFKIGCCRTIFAQYADPVGHVVCGNKNYIVFPGIILCFALQGITIRGEKNNQHQHMLSVFHTSPFTKGTYSKGHIIMMSIMNAAWPYVSVNIIGPAATKK